MKWPACESATDPLSEVGWSTEISEAPPWPKIAIALYAPVIVGASLARPINTAGVAGGVRARPAGSRRHDSSTTIPRLSYTQAEMELRGNSERRDLGR